VAGIGHSA
jgi:hypothetical protein